jgi:glycolate oxidase FAD binding subunit
VGQLARTLATAGQRLALDAPAEATIGGVIATGTAGPLRFRYGPARDLLIGITVVRPDGVVAHSGGKVVKNVAGYDLGKLFAGSRGTLGLITEATFRLHPLPQAVAYVVAEFPPDQTDRAARAAIAVAGSPLAPAAVELDWPETGGPLRIGVALEGTASGVAARAEQVSVLLVGPDPGIADPAIAVGDAAPSWWGRHPVGPEVAPDRAGTVIRVSCWLAEMAGVLRAFGAPALECGVRPAVGGSIGAGVLYARLDPGTGPEAAASYVRRVRELAAGTGPSAFPARGSTVVLTAPSRVLAEVDVQGPVPGAALMRAVKSQFDPAGRFGPVLASRSPADGAE